MSAVLTGLVLFSRLSPGLRPGLKNVKAFEKAMDKMFKSFPPQKK
jgi:hypothetical protein